MYYDPAKTTAAVATLSAEALPAEFVPVTTTVMTEPTSPMTGV
jgi:hypothetical protein